jgi:tRNA A37 threonylcarbamoyladenosine synthetase subunit TsaC/SUA5/YrdC
MMNEFDIKFLNRPLKTQKMRDSEDNERLKKYPKTTIRIRMPDHTIIQAVFQSKERGEKKVY